MRFAHDFVTFYSEITLPDNFGNWHFLFYYCTLAKTLDGGYFNFPPFVVEIHLPLISVFTFPSLEKQIFRPLCTEVNLIKYFHSYYWKVTWKIWSLKNLDFLFCVLSKILNSYQYYVLILTNGFKWLLVSAYVNDASKGIQFFMLHETNAKLVQWFCSSGFPLSCEI